MSSTALEETATVTLEPAVPMASREVAELRAASIRGALEFAVDLFVAAYRERDYVALGYGTGQAGWETYLRDRYGDLEFRLPADMRRQRVEELATGGVTSVRAISAVPGMGSKSQTAEDLKTLREAGRLVDVADGAGLDGKVQRRQDRPERPAARLERIRQQLAEDNLSVDQAVTAAVDALGDANRYEVAEALRIRDGRASASLSRLHHHKARLEPAGFRDGVTVYRLARPMLEA